MNIINQILETSDKCASVALLQEAKAPLWGRFCVTYMYYQERSGNRQMKPNQNSPYQVLLTIICVRAILSVCGDVVCIAPNMISELLLHVVFIGG